MRDANALGGGDAAPQLISEREIGGRHGVAAVVRRAPAGRGLDGLLLVEQHREQQRAVDGGGRLVGVGVGGGLGLGLGLGLGFRLGLGLGLGSGPGAELGSW